MQLDEVIDVNLGRFLKALRIERELKIAHVSKQTGIKYHRIQALECGTSHKGITKNECTLLAAVFEIEPYILFTKAVGSEYTYN